MGYVICYFSTAHANLAKKDLEVLFESVKLSNYELGVTGILIHSRGNFFQILEGSEEIVKSLYRKILHDMRHYDLIKVIDEGDHQPMFEGYSFEFLTVSNSYEKQFVVKILDEEYEESSRYKSIAYLTKKFVGDSVA